MESYFSQWPTFLKVVGLIAVALIILKLIFASLHTLFWLILVIALLGLLYSLAQNLGFFNLWPVNLDLINQIKF